MKGIFHPDICHDWESSFSSPQELRKLDPAEDGYLIEYIVRHAYGRRRQLLMHKLGISELPEERVNHDDPSDTLYEEYFVLREQVAREPDTEVLKEAAYDAPAQMAAFAFCYLTKYCYPSSRNDAYGYRTYECGWKEGITTEEVVDFCREMIEVQGPFAEEAKEVLADPPKDHNDFYGKRMVSHERPVSGPPYVRRERLAPFHESEEYEKSRAEVLRLEARAREVLAAGDRDSAIILLMELSRKAEQLGKYTQRWEAIDDYVRCCITIAEVCDNADDAEKAAGILRRLIRECPEEKVYREQLVRAEEVYRKALKEIAVQTGFVDEDSPIVFYHSFEAEDAEVICRLLEERFRSGGGRRRIEFRRQEPAPSSWDAFGGAQRSPKFRWEEPTYPVYEIDDDSRHEIGSICCCDLPTMIKLYFKTGNIDVISPFIETDNVFPALLEQGRFEGELCGLPVLVFSGADEEAADFKSAGTAPEKAPGSSPEKAPCSSPEKAPCSSSAKAPCSSSAKAPGSASAKAPGSAEGFRTCFAFMNSNNYGLKLLDCLDLLMLMTDSDFLFDVCRACNAGGKAPHVFPADRKGCQAG